MTDLDAKSEAARALNRARWGGRVAARAARVVIERRAELSDAELAELADALNEDRATGGEAA